MRVVRTLEIAIAKVSSLPDADQEQIGRWLLSQVEKLRHLRAEIDKGIRSLTHARVSRSISKIFFDVKTIGMTDRRPPIIWSSDALADLSDT
jgi:hypothetical protein